MRLCGSQCLCVENILSNIHHKDSENRRACTEKNKLGHHICPFQIAPDGEPFETDAASLTICLCGTDTNFICLAAKKPFRRNYENHSFNRRSGRFNRSSRYLCRRANVPTACINAHARTETQRDAGCEP